MWFSFQKVLPWTVCGEWASNCCKLDDENKTEGNEFILFMNEFFLECFRKS